MNKNISGKIISVFVAVTMLVSLLPIVFAEGESSNVIFPITIKQGISTNTVPFASGVEKVDVTTKYTFNKGTSAAYADESGQYSALDFFSQNATEAEKDNVNFGISFGQDISSLISDPTKVFLSFDYCPSAKPDVSQIYIGSMYLNNGTWVKRPSINLAKYTALTASTWVRIELSLADLGITASDNAFGGIYFVYNNIAIPASTGKLWDHVARAFDMAIVNSIGETAKSTVVEGQGEAVELLTNTTLALKASAGFPATTSTGATVKSFGAWSKGVVAANNPAAIGDVGYYNLPSASAFTSAIPGDIEDYTLVVTFTKAADYTYLDNIELGLGNANGTSGFTSLPTVVKTIPLTTIDPTFDYTLPKNTVWTLSVKVSDILNNGNETKFPGTGSNASKAINELTGANINLFTVKGTYIRDSSGTAQMLKFTSIGLAAPAVELTNTTPAVGDISWAAASGSPICYSVFNSDGTKLCDTTATTVANTAGGTYSVYAYYGNGNYSKELVITSVAPTATPEPTATPVPDPIQEDIDTYTNFTVSDDTDCDGATYTLNANQTMTITDFALKNATVDTNGGSIVLDGATITGIVNFDANGKISVDEGNTATAVSGSDKAFFLARTLGGEAEKSFTLTADGTINKLITLNVGGLSGKTVFGITVCNIPTGRTVTISD